MQLDAAVIYLGSYVEAKLSELEEVRSSHGTSFQPRFRTAEEFFKSLEQPSSQEANLLALKTLAQRMGAFSKS